MSGREHEGDGQEPDSTDATATSDAGARESQPHGEYGARRVTGGATPELIAEGEAEAKENAAKPEQREWWDDPRMPWQGEPSTADKRCWTAFMLLGIYGMVMIPLRPKILALDPHALVTISGSTIGVIDIGAGLRLGGENLWWMWLLIAALSLIKFDWIFWWAGRLWGRGMIEVIAGRSRWAARTAHHAERLAERFGSLATFLVVLIPFLPSAVVFVFVGSAGMSLRRFLVIDYLASLVNRAFYLYLGYRLGQPAKDVVDVIQKYSTWIMIALVIVVVVNSVRQSRRSQASL
ncbi:DedA family protein [Dermacoccaceae bacterium W4C1]